MPTSIEPTRSPDVQPAPPVMRPRVETNPPETCLAPELAEGSICAPGLDRLETDCLQAAVEVLGDDALQECAGFRLPSGFCLSILMPVYNERATICQVIERVRSLPLPHELIIVDDGSTDGTRDLLDAYRGQPGVEIVFHARNQGKGGALRTALTRARGEIIAIQDADLEYDPGEFVQLIEPVIRGEADVVYGSRFLQGKPPRQTWLHWLANRLLTGMSNLFNDLELTDMETCQKVIHRRALSGLTIEERRFGVEPELTAKLARRGCRFVERPIGYWARGVDEGKKIGLRDAFNALYCIVRYSF